jgi:hypothetical protein
MQNENQKDNSSIISSNETPVNLEKSKKIDRLTSAVDAEMNLTQKSDSSLKQREELDQNPLATVDKSVVADSKWNSQKQNPKGPAQPDVKR